MSEAQLKKIKAEKLEMRDFFLEDVHEQGKARQKGGRP